MEWKGHWIWLAQEPPSSVNLRVLARKRFRVKGKTVRQASLAITADSRYRLLINGRWVNDGPARAFPWQYAYDPVDITPYLQAGENVIAVIVQHHGEGTFQSLVTRPGLLAQLDIDRHIVSSDTSWRMMIDPSYNQLSPRISCQLPHEEQVDGRKEPVGWQTPGFDDSAWPKAKIIARASEGPWSNLTPRDIPLLATERIEPVRIVSRRHVQSPNFIETINLDRAFRPGNGKTGIRAFNGALLTAVESPVSQRVMFFKPQGLRPARCFLNGRKINDPKTLYLHKGSNLLYAIFEGPRSDNEFQIVLHADRPPVLKNPLGRGKWSVAGPFEPADPDWENKSYSGIHTTRHRPSFDPDDPAWDAIKIVKDFKGLTRRGLTGHFYEPPAMACVGPDIHAATIHPIPCPQGDLEVVYDFGKELNARVELELTAPAGQVIDATTFEAYLDSRPQYTGNCRTGFRYITRKGSQRFTTFRNYGMRYLALTFRNYGKSVELPNVTALFVHHPVEHRGQFHCNDYRLNALWQTGKHTLLCCMEDTFTDCPTYEQALWVGDARNEALVCHMTFGRYDLTRRCVKLPALSLRQADLTVCQVPSAWDHVMPTWSLLWVQMVWEHFYYSGDRTTMAELYPAVSHMLETINEKYLDADTGLFRIAAGNMFDWTDMDTGTALTTHNNIFLTAALKTAALMAQVLQKKNNWSDRAKDLVRKINRFLWSPKQGAYIDSIHNDGSPSSRISRPTNTVALLYDIAPPDRVQKILPIVLGRQTKHIVPFGSPFAAFFLLESLAKLERFNDLLTLIRNQWGFMLDRGATTFWETFTTPRSHCHAWSAAPTYFLSRYILGIHPVEPGFRKFLLSPRFGDLQFAEGTVPTPAGDIQVRWHRKGTHIEMEAQKPSHIESLVRLPGNFETVSRHVTKTKIQIHAKATNG